MIRTLMIVLILLPHMVPTAHGDQLTVLFLGNSHTYFNDLPGLIRGLAESAGDTFLTDQSTPGGCTLAYPPNAHLYNDVSVGLIESGGWDYMVLQEQSQIPVIPYIRDNYMYPGSATLDSINTANTPCCLTTFFMTWGWRDGGQHTIDGYSSPVFEDYYEMQDSVRTAYLRIADSLSAPVAPAGVAWQNAMNSGYPLSLHAPDGYHPSLSGSYLAACVFYAALFQKSPLGLDYNGGLSDENAGWLQAVADTTVLNHLDEWNISPAMPYQPFEYDWALPPQCQPRRDPFMRYRFIKPMEECSLSRPSSQIYKDHDETHRSKHSIRSFQGPSMVPGFDARQLHTDHYSNIRIVTPDGED